MVLSLVRFGVRKNNNVIVCEKRKKICYDDVKGKNIEIIK